MTITETQKATFISELRWARLHNFKDETAKTFNAYAIATAMRIPFGSRRFQEIEDELDRIAKEAA